MTEQLEYLAVLKKYKAYLIFTGQDFDFTGLNSEIKRLEEETYCPFIGE